MTLVPEVRRGGGLPFGQFASQWMCDPRYTANLRTLYGILVTYADIRVRDTSKGRPYRPELARQLRCSVSTVDRVILEGECAGLWRVERRLDPANPKLNDASIYHLFDADFWQGTWSDPLGPDEWADEVAKRVLEERRRKKREAGYVHKGGKGGSKPGVPKRRKKPGGGVTHDATPGVMGDATVASPMTPNVDSPLQNQKRRDAPEARSAPDARRASHVSDAHASTRGGPAAEEGAAAPEDSPSPSTKATTGSSRSPGASPRPTRRRSLTAAQAAAVRAVEAVWPDALREALPARRPATLTEAILTAAACRTPEELAARVIRRWSAHGYAQAVAPGGPGLTSPVGVAVALVRPEECGNPLCEDGTDTGSGMPCSGCERRRQDARAAAGRSRVPTARTLTWECTGCAAPGRGTPPEDGVCRACREAAEAAAAAEEWLAADQAWREERSAVPAAEPAAICLGCYQPVPVGTDYCPDHIPLGTPDHNGGCTGLDGEGCGRQVAARGVCRPCLVHALKEVQVGA